MIQKDSGVEYPRSGSNPGGCSVMVNGLPPIACKRQFGSTECACGQGYAPNWPKFYEWCERWLSYPTTWAVIPDVVDAGAQMQDALLREWPFGHRGAPVWHMDEPIERLFHLCEIWPRVCIGSTAEFAVVGADLWHSRMEEVFNGLERIFKLMPWIHMLRGMQMSGTIYPFASVDSTDIAQNHNRPQNVALDMADRWDAKQCPGTWVRRKKKEQFTLVAA